MRSLQVSMSKSLGRCKHCARGREQTRSHARVGRWFSVYVKLRDSTPFRLADCLADIPREDIKVGFLLILMAIPRGLEPRTC